MEQVGPFFLICFYSFFHVRHGGMKHVRIFQIHKWHCGMWWRWNVSGQEDSDGTVALFHNSKQEPCCSYWWGGNRDHVFFGKIFNLMYLDIRNRKQNLISNSGVTYVFQNGHMKQLTFVVFFHEIASCHTLSEHIKTSTLPTKELGWCVAWQPIGVKMLSIGHVAQGHTTCRKTVDSVDWWWWLWCIWGNSRARWCTRIWDNYTYHICIVRSWFDALLCHFACLSMLGLLQLRYSRATLISTRLVNGYYVMFLYDQINIDPSLTFTVPWLDVYYWSINLYILSFDWYLMIHFQPVTPHTPPLQLDLIRISGWWAHRTRPFIQTVGYHYCKLLSPARAMEWIYVDGLKAWIEKQVVWLGCLELRPDRVSKLVQLLHLYCCHLWLSAAGACSGVLWYKECHRDYCLRGGLQGFLQETTVW